MALPYEFEVVASDVNANLLAIVGIQTAIDALPATPLEADLPDIVQIVKDLKDATESLATNLSTFVELIKKVRVNQG